MPAGAAGGRLARRLLAEGLELNRRLLLHCFDGVDEAAALQRIDQRTNHMAFVACHLVDARFYLARLLGAPVGQPFGGRLEEARSIDDIDTFPALSEILETWREIGATLGRILEQVPEHELDRESPIELPITDPSRRAACQFLLQHEAFHIGQLALLRKQLGFEAMRWAAD